MKNTGNLFQTVSLAVIIAAMPAMASAADVILSGAVKSAAGEKLGGVMISAKGEGTTITTMDSLLLHGEVIYAQHHVFGWGDDRFTIRRFEQILGGEHKITRFSHSFL